MKYCTKCGSDLAGRTRFCGHCGAPLLGAGHSPDTLALSVAMLPWRITKRLAKAVFTARSPWVRWGVPAAVVIVLAGAFGSRQDSAVTGSPGATKRVSSAEHAPKRPVEVELAIIEAGGYVSDDDIRVARFRSLLRQLTETYDLTAQQIADQTVKAQEMLREQGVQDGLTDIMTGMNQLFSTRQQGKQYTEALAMYVTMREKGTSPQDAFQAIEGIARISEASQK